MRAQAIASGRSHMPGVGHLAEGRANRLAARDRRTGAGRPPGPWLVGPGPLRSTPQGSAGSAPRAYRWAASCGPPCAGHNPTAQGPKTANRYPSATFRQPPTGYQRRRLDAAICLRHSLRSKSARA
jgi:hypothetical protein